MAGGKTSALTPFVMSIKRYSSPCAKFTINVMVDNKQKAIVFDRYDHDQKRRFIDIDDSLIQGQIENSQDFNVYFKLDFEIADEEESEPKEEIKPDLPKIPKVFTTMNEAKKWLNKNHDAPYNRMVNGAMTIHEYEFYGFELKIEPLKK